MVTLEKADRSSFSAGLQEERKNQSKALASEHKQKAFKPQAKKRKRINRTNERLAVERSVKVVGFFPSIEDRERPISSI